MLTISMLARVGIQVPAEAIYLQADSQVYRPEEVQDLAEVVAEVVVRAQGLQAEEV